MTVCTNVLFIMFAVKITGANIEYSTDAVCLFEILLSVLACINNRSGRILSSVDIDDTLSYNDISYTK